MKAINLAWIISNFDQSILERFGVNLLSTSTQGIDHICYCNVWKSLWCLFFLSLILKSLILNPNNVEKRIILCGIKKVVLSVPINFFFGQVFNIKRMNNFFIILLDRIITLWWRWFFGELLISGIANIGRHTCEHCQMSPFRNCKFTEVSETEQKSYLLGQFKLRLFPLIFVVKKFKFHHNLEIDTIP